MTTRPRPARGFTLIELVLAIGLTSALMVGLTSAVLVGIRAMPRSDEPAIVRVQCHNAIATLADELSAALYINTTSATTVDFVVPDYNGDGVPERIVYQWSGTALDPLTRSMNGCQYSSSSGTQSCSPRDTSSRRSSSRAVNS